MERTGTAQLQQLRRMLGELLACRRVPLGPPPDLAATGNARYDFLVTGGTSTEWYVALFCDFDSTCFTSRGDWKGRDHTPAAFPCRAAIIHAILRAERACSTQRRDGERLVVLLLMSHQYQKNVLRVAPRDLVTRLNAQQSVLRVECWPSHDLAYNPLRHMYVSPHTIIPASEHAALLRRLRCATVQHLKRLAPTDIICRWIGAGEGCIVRVDHQSQYFGPQSDYFRVA